MKRTSAFVLVFLFVWTSIDGVAQTKFVPPPTPLIPVTDTLHGMPLTDNFRWLEEKTDQRVIDWTLAQHNYGVQFLNATLKKHDGLREEITAFIDMDYEGPYSKEGGRIFQYIMRKGDKQDKLYTLLKGKKNLIWDPVKLDSTGKTSTQGIEYTFDGERAAISAQRSGDEVSTTYIINTRTGKILYTPIENTKSFNWTKDQQHAYVTFRSPQDIKDQKPLKCYMLKIGDPVEKAEFLGTTTDAKNEYYVYDNRYSDVTFYGELDFYTNSCFIRRTGTLDQGKLIYKSDQYKAYPEAIDSTLYIMTNDHAPNFKLMIADKANPEFEKWKVLVPESDMVLQSYVVTKNNIIVQRKIDTQSRLTLYDLKGSKIRELDLPDLGSVSNITYKREEDSIYVRLSTFTSTAKIYVASTSNFKWRLFYQRKLPIDMNNITGEIKFYTSKDGTKVPAFIVHRKDMKLDGKNPVLLTAYGGFNLGKSPHYFGYWASFINRGGVVVEAGIRGGDEYGEKWHEGGMKGNKQNCFDDFNSCAEWLIKEKYTNPSKLAAEGGSNGGLLMGAVATQRPDLYKAILCEVPLLDMMRYHKFLIARYWIPEYGSSENEADFRWLLAYSPYHNIRYGVNLPTMLVTAGANDSRVDPMNAKKFVAAAQNNPGQINPIILHMDYDSGHGSGQSTKQEIENTLFSYEFLLNQLGM
jgi:prolyl oligopeptidase